MSFLCFIYGGLIFTVGAAAAIGLVVGVIHTIEWLDEQFGWIAPAIFIALLVMILGGVMIGPELCKK